MEVPNSSEHQHYEYNNDYFNPENSIRLLKFLDVSTDKNKLCAVSCKLVIWPLSEAGDIPPFNAISYTWGDPKDSKNQERMLIRNQVLMITKNCEDALKQAWRYNKEAWYWVDSVCIDQHNKKEKAFQVPLMSHIYGTAEHVLACVGQHADGSNELFRFIEDKSKILHSRKLRYEASIRKGYEQTCMQTLENFLTRSYFTRVWILQELYLATRVEFLCGPDSVSAKEIQGLSRCIHDLPTARELLEAAVSEGDRRISLKDALRAVDNAKLQCYLVEDKIFGVLAMVNWKDKARIIPNYEERDVFNLAVTVLAKILELEGHVSQVDAYETARLIGGLLGLLDADDKGSISGLDAAINRRRSLIPMNPRESLQVHPEEDRNSSAVTCYGWRIRGRRETSHWFLEGYKDGFQIAVPFRPAAEDKTEIWLPKRTEPGDWYLVPGGGKSHFLHGLVLIVRSSSTWTNPGCHDIVGIGFDHGLAAERKGMNAHYNRFGVVASCEDRLFLLIALGVYHQAMDEKSSQRPGPWSQVSALLRARFSGAKDFSFAFSIRWPGQGEFLPDHVSAAVGK